MLKKFKADMHIHTCLSPCAELDMSPAAITKQAKLKGIDILGICDHNSAENAEALMKAAEKHNITILPGLEISSQEEVHILALFDKLENAIKLQGIIYNHLDGENDEKIFGLQVVVNERGEVCRLNKKLLIGASTLSTEVIVQTIHTLEGLAIASHIDREGFSLYGQLGFIPEDLHLDALEISPHMTHDEAQNKFNSPLPLTCSSDAHVLQDIGEGYTLFFMQKRTVGEIKKALRSEDNRKIIQ